MNAQALATRLALESLITVELEAPTSDNSDLEGNQEQRCANRDRVGEDDWDLMQDEAENLFVQEHQECRRHRNGRIMRHSW